MSSSRDNTVLWIGGGLLVALLCCLCLALSVGGFAYWIARQAAGPGGRRVPTSVFTPLEQAPPQPRLVTPVPDEAEAMRTALAQNVVPISDPVDLAARLLGEHDAPRVVADHASPIAVGTRQTFWATDTDTSEDFQVQARLAYATDHVYFWVEDGVDYDQQALETLVDEFEQHTYPTDREFFGSEWTPGVDGDPHLYMLYARGLGSSVAGYFSSSDEYAPSVHEYSNAHEMFYISADGAALDDDYTRGVLAHEFQHMIHWYLDRNEDTWMNEGFAEVAAFINGFDVGGADTIYALNPDETLARWPAPPLEDTTSHYGQAFLLLSYFLDRFGADVTQALVAHDANGLDSIDQTLAEKDVRDPGTGEPLNADSVFADWAVAMLVQDPSVAQGQYSFESYPSAPSPALTETVTQCPGASGSRTVSQYGVDYIRIDCPGDFTLSFDGSNTVPVLPADPHSGQYAFWSNRGDESDMTLTRAFDLSQVSGAVTLDYWTWYDLEQDYDYLYLEASSDGGQTWSIVKTPSGTDEDPSGNSYGWGYNGPSGGGAQAQWIEESVDLSQYAGQEILLRFEYVTDAAVNGEGLLLDDVRIDAIDYQEGFEAGDGGWQGDGFIRLFNLLPQTYRVMLVEFGDQVTVQPVALDESQHGEVALHLGDSVNRAVLVITGTTRSTWQTADYSYRIAR